MIGMGKVLRNRNQISGLVLLVGLVAGSLFANIYCKDNVSELGVFSYDFMDKMQGMNIKGAELFRYVLMERLKFWGLFFLLSFSGIGMMLYFAYMAVFGFLMGITCSFMVMMHGAMGMVYFLVLCLISQMILLISVLVAMVVGIGQQKHQLSVRQMVLMALVSLLLLFLSALVETALNLNFMKYNHYY